MRVSGSKMQVCAGRLERDTAKAVEPETVDCAESLIGFDPEKAEERCYRRSMV